MLLLGLGSNLPSSLGNRFKNIDMAITCLQSYKIKLIKKSSFYETPSYPNKKDPKFLNIGLEIKSKQSPGQLIKKFNKIEKMLHRIRGKKNQPRTCDIDLIDYEGKILNSKRLITPHPRAHLRNFVLFPMKEIHPTWVHPILNKRIDFLIKKLSFKLRNEITRIKEHVTID